MLWFFFWFNHIKISNFTTKKLNKTQLMKSLLILLLTSFAFFSTSQSIALKRAYILKVSETTGDIIYQGKTKSTITFIISDSTVQHTQIKKKNEEVISDLTYNILKKEMIEKIHTIHMEADGIEYILLIPKNRRKKVALSSNKVTTIISGSTKKLD